MFCKPTHPVGRVHKTRSIPILKRSYSDDHCPPPVEGNNVVDIKVASGGSTCRTLSESDKGLADTRDYYIRDYPAREYSARTDSEVSKLSLSWHGIIDYN